MPTDALFDRRAVLDNLGGDVEIMQLLGRTFIDDAPRLLAHLHDALARRDVAAAVHAGHGIKGSAANFGAAPLLRAITALEQACRAGDFTGAERLHPQVQALVAGLCRELAAP